ncbi:MAG: hypothetical protein ACJAZ9_000551 [Neolewinella sp.]|jgi:hypothetical protein
MFFYLNSLDYKVIGKTDGISQINTDLTKIRSYFSLDTCLPRQVHQHIEQCRQIAPFKLASPNTILTDLCFSGEASYLQRVISPKLKAILENFMGFNAFFFPVLIYDHSGKSHDYYLLHFQEALSEDFIDFERTVYSALDKSGYDLGEIVGRSKAEQDKSLITRIKRFAFKKGHKLPDYFASPLNLNYFISSDLTDCLIASEVTGIDIYKYDNHSDLGINTIRATNHQVY